MFWRVQVIPGHARTKMEIMAFIFRLPRPMGLGTTGAGKGPTIVAVIKNIADTAGVINVEEHSNRPLSRTAPIKLGQALQKPCPFTIQILIKITIFEIMALHGSLVCDSENWCTY